MKKTLIILVSLIGLVIILAGCATGLTPSSWPGMVVDSNNVYIAGGPFVYAVNLQTGTQAWRFPEKASVANPFYATPALTTDGQLIVGGFDKKLYSLNLQTGAENWQFTEARDRWIGGVLIVDDMIYAPNADYKIYALNTQGNLQWSFEADQSIWGTPVSDGTNIYFGTLGRNVYALNAGTGALVWDQPINGAILGNIVLGSDRTLYIGTHAGMLYALNARDGRIKWSVTNTSWVWTGPVVDGSAMYFGDAGGLLHAQPIDGSAELWKQQLNGSIIGSPLVVGNNLVVGTEAGTGTETGNLYFVSSDGQSVRPISIPGQAGKFYSSPISAGTKILVAPTGGDAALIALDQTGTILWSFIPPK